MYTDITGIILSGGKSSRMGSNKSLLKLKDRTVIEIVADIMKNLFNNVVVISNDPHEYAFLGLPVHKDIFPGRGPLSGIHSGLANSQTARNFIISCDIPLITAEMIKYLVDYAAPHPVTVARADGYIQQLCGVYNRSCLNTAEKLLVSDNQEEIREGIQKNRKCRVLSMIEELGVEVIDAEGLPFYKKDIFFNMNRPSDFEYVLKKFGNP